MERYLHILQNCRLFHDIQDTDLLKMLHCLGARIEHFDKKHSIFLEGKPAKYVGIVLSGSVQIIRIDYYGNRSILSEARQGDLFCEAFACAEIKEMPFSVIANEPSSIMLIDCSHILRTCEHQCSFHHQMIFNLMKNLAARSVEYHQKIEIASKRTTRDKLLAYLTIQAEKAGSNCFTIPFDRQELADYLDVDRSGLSVEISKLQKAGNLRSRKNYFELL